MNEKQAGGDILGRMAGLISRPFVGAQKSQAVQNKVVGGITRYVNQPIENALRRTGVHKAISKAYEYGTVPIPGTPKLVQPVLPTADQRRAYGQWRADDLVHTFAHNPEIVGALAIPAPGVTESYLAGKHVASKLLGGGRPAAAVPAAVPAPTGLKKLASISAFADELEKIAEVLPYQQKTQWTCSAACLKAVLNHHGVEVPELLLIQLIGARPGRGAECDQIANAARKLGFSAFEYSFANLDQAKVLLDQDLPIICDIQSFNHPGKGHYVVMTGIEDVVHLMDPNTPGNTREISKEEMEERWWDRAMAPPHQMMPKWGIVVVPPEEGHDDSVTTESIT